MSAPDSTSVGVTPEYGSDDDNSTYNVVQNLPGVKTTAMVFKALKIWRPSAQTVAEDIHNEEVDEAIGLRPSKAAQARQQVRDMMLYLLFVGLFTASMMSDRGSQLFFFTNALKRQLVMSEGGESSDFEDIRTVADGYEWLQQSLVPSLYSADSFDGDANFTAFSSSAQQEGQYSPNFPGAIVGQGRVLGGVRLGQSRVAASACEQPPALSPGTLFPSYAWQCRADSNRLSAEFKGWPNPIANLSRTTAPTGPGLTSPVTGVGLQEVNVYVTLPNPAQPGSRSSAEGIVKSLQSNHFVDLDSLSLVAEVNVYNVNLDYMCLVQLVLEFPRGGGVLPWSRFTTIRLYRDYRATDVLRLVLEVATLLLVVVYSVKEVRKLYSYGLLPYLETFSVTHNLNLLLFYIAVAHRAMAWLELPASVDATGSSFIPMRTSANYLAIADDVNAFNALLTWLKVFNYLNFVPRFQILLGTLTRASGQISGFAIICAVVLFGSSLAFTLLFGKNVEGFRNLTHSFHSLGRVLLGDFSFDALRSEQPFLGPIIFYIFIMLAVFVLLNMFIAIISDAFNEEKDRLALMDDFGVETLGQHVADALLESMSGLPLLGRLVRGARQKIAFYRFKVLHNRHLKQLALLADANQDNEVSADEIAASLDKDANGHVTSQEVHDALIASGASDDAAHEIIDTIPFDKHGVVSTAILAQLFKAAQDDTSPDPGFASAHSAHSHSMHSMPSPQKRGTPLPAVAEHGAGDKSSEVKAEDTPGSSARPTVNLSPQRTSAWDSPAPSSLPSVASMHGDTAMRAVNRLRIGIAGAKMVTRDSKAAGLRGSPIISKSGVIRPPPRRPPPPTRPSNAKVHGKSRASMSPGLRYRARSRLRPPPRPPSMLSGSSSSTETESALRDVNSRISAMEQMLLNSLQQQSHFLHSIETRNRSMEHSLHTVLSGFDSRELAAHQAMLSPPQRRRSRTLSPLHATPSNEGREDGAGSGGGEGMDDGESEPQVAYSGSVVNSVPGSFVPGTMVHRRSVPNDDDNVM